MITESHIIKLIKKYIKMFMCCCVGSTIGEGEPEGLAREGAIYIDEEAPALYYYDGTEWVVLPSAPPSLWERTGTILSPTTEDDSIELTGAKTISTPNQQTFADNAAAITGGCIVGEHYKTPDGKQQVVVASNPTIPKIYTLILRFDLDTIGFDSLSAGDPISGTILYDDCTLGTGLSVSKNDSVSNSAPCIRIGIVKSFEIVEINNIFFREDDRYYLTEYGFNDGEYNVIDIIAWREGALNAIGENLGFITTTIKFIKP